MSANLPASRSWLATRPAHSRGARATEQLQREALLMRPILCPPWLGRKGTRFRREPGGARRRCPSGIRREACCRGSWSYEIGLGSGGWWGKTAIARVGGAARGVRVSGGGPFGEVRSSADGVPLRRPHRRGSSAMTLRRSTTWSRRRAAFSNSRLREATFICASRSFVSRSRSSLGMSPWTT